MMRISSDQVGQIHDETIHRLTRSTVPWLRADHVELVNEISDTDLNTHVEKTIRFALGAKVAQESNVRSIVVYHLQEDSDPTNGVANVLMREGFSEDERVAAYINGSKNQRKIIKLDSPLTATGDAL